MRLHLTPLDKDPPDGYILPRGGVLCEGSWGGSGTFTFLVTFPDVGLTCRRRAVTYKGKIENNKDLRKVLSVKGKKKKEEIDVFHGEFERHLFVFPPQDHLLLPLLGLHLLQLVLQEEGDNE